MNRIARRSLLIVSLVLAGSLVVGCSDKPKEISSIEQNKAKLLVDEAQFALQLRDFKRAEGLVQQAVKIHDGMPEYHVMLGIISKRLNKPAEAKKAYERGLALHEYLYKSKKEPKDLVQQAWVLALLGRTDDALKTLNKAKELHPKDDYVAEMTDPEVGLARTFKDAGFKELTL